MSQEALKESAGLDVFKFLITYNFYITLKKHFKKNVYNILNIISLLQHLNVQPKHDK